MIAGLARTLRSEMIKVRRSPSLWTLLIVTLAISVGLTAIIAGLGGAPALYERQSADGGSRYEVLFFGAALGVWAYAFFGAAFSAGEFGGGLVGYTFVVTPRRSRVVFAKLILVAVLGVVAGVVVSLINFVITQTVLRAGGYPALSFDDPQLVRAVLVFIPAQMAVWGCLALLLGFVVRRTAVTVIGLFLGSFLPVVMAQFLPRAWGETVPRWMPGAAMESLAGLATPGSPGFLPVLPALLAIVGWLVLGILVSLVWVGRRDV